jgi:hypothetical protein
VISGPGSRVEASTADREVRSRPWSPADPARNADPPAGRPALSSVSTDHTDGPSLAARASGERSGLVVVVVSSSASASSMGRRSGGGATGAPRRMYWLSLLAQSTAPVNPVTTPMRTTTIAMVTAFGRTNSPARTR